MELLPEEILAQIFGFLPGYKLPILKLVCKTFRDVIDHNEVWSYVINHELTANPMLLKGDSYQTYYQRAFLGPNRTAKRYCIESHSALSTLEERVGWLADLGYKFFAINLQLADHQDVPDHRRMLDFAAKFGYEVLGRKLIQILNNHKDDSLEYDKCWLSPFETALHSNRFHFVEMLLHNPGPLQNPWILESVESVPTSTFSSHVNVLISSGEDGRQLLLQYLLQFKMPTLHRAVITRDMEKIQNAIKSGAKINECDKYDMSPLSYATMLGYREIIEVLINYGAKIREDINNSFVIAMREENLEIFQTLVRRDTSERSLLYAICRAVNEGKQTHLDLINEYGPENIGECVRKNIVSIMKYRLDAELPLLKPLYATKLSFTKQQLTTIVRLIPHMFNFKSIKYDYYDYSSFIVLVNYMSNNPTFPMSIAERLPCYQFITFFLELLKDKELQECCKILFYFVIDNRSYKLFKPDLQAVYDSITIIYLQTLLKACNNEIDVNEPSLTNNQTPLHVAAKNGQLDIIKLLLDNGAERDLADGSEKTAAELTTDYRCKELLAA
ncbi:hypothetical protein TrispH2_007998 [Trichoplax sp. H2]|nr:hypothetical protein TrispH2_007998 [Trichoplax sp. H2]|eukprot:RDD39689.1 hypothetical protein TrispH2_007998 [Trichoplax sp. H2]